MPQTDKKSQNYELWDSTSHSPLDIKPEDFAAGVSAVEAPANPYRDWDRDRAEIVINRKTVQQLLEEENNPNFQVVEGETTRPGFPSQQSLQEFINKHLLQEATELSDEQKAKAAIYLADELLHQGALLHPATTALQMALKDINAKETSQTLAIPVLDLEDKSLLQKRTTAFVTTPTGFLAQETVTQKKILKMNNVTSVDARDDTVEISGKEFALKAQATFAVDLSTNKLDKSSVSPRSNAITYGSNEARELLDKRGLKDRFIDFILKLFSHASAKIENLIHKGPLKPNIEMTERPRSGPK